MKRLLVAAGVVCLAAAIPIAVSGAASAAGTATVYVVHGIPNTPVDVYVDGAKALDDFAPGTVKGPLQVPSGKHMIAITAANAKDASKPVLSGSADLADGANVSLVAHLTADGVPALTAFPDDVSMIKAGQARLVVRHTAAAPAVDIRAGGAVVLAGVSNPQQGMLDVPAGTVSADVVLAGTKTVVIGPADLNLAAGSATFVHAIGSAADKTLGVVAFTIAGMGGAPSGVPAGTGPVRSPIDDIPVGLVLVIGAAGLAVAGFSGRRLLAGRTR